MDAAPRPRVLDELILTVVVDNETDTLSSIDTGVPQLPEVGSHLGRVEPTVHDGKTCYQVFDHLCVACHGYSVVATARAGDAAHTVLFDVGPYGDVWLDNAERLGIDLAAIEVLVLSHWHWDHSGGIPTVAAAIAKARRDAGRDPLVVDLHPDRPDQRGVEVSPGSIVTLPPEPSIDEIERAGGRTVLSDAVHLVGGDLFVASGPIPRRTSYETGLVGHQSFRGGVATPDPLIMDERFLAAHVGGRGLTVLSACSHAGVVNACLGARELFGDEAVDVVLGGYHLAGAAMEPRIADTVGDLERLIAPKVVAPGHCTGWRAKAALAERFAPGRYGPSMVGSTYVLRGDGEG